MKNFIVIIVLLFIQVGYLKAGDPYEIHDTLTYDLEIYENGSKELTTQFSKAQLGIPAYADLYQDADFLIPGVVFILYKNGIEAESNTVTAPNTEGYYKNVFALSATETNYYSVKIKFRYKINCFSTTDCEEYIHEDTTPDIDDRKRGHSISVQIPADFIPNCEDGTFEIKTKVFANSLPDDPSNVTICPGVTILNCTFISQFKVEWLLIKNGVLQSSQSGGTTFSGGTRWENTFTIAANQPGSYQVRLRFNYMIFSWFGINTDYFIHDEFTDTYVINNPSQYCCTSNITVSANVPVSGTDNREAALTLSASNIINNNANAKYHASNEVSLMPGFSTVTGSFFHAYNEGCSGTFYRQSAYTNEQNLASEETVPTKAAYKLPVSINRIFVSPNPTNGIFKISIPIDDPKNIRIYDIYGKTLFERFNVTEQNLSYDLSQYSAGVYFIRVNCADKIISGKIIKN